MVWVDPQDYAMPPLHLAVYDVVLGNGDLVASELSSRQGSPNASNGFFKHVSSEP